MKNKGIILLIMLLLGVAAVFGLRDHSGRSPKKAAVGLEAPDFTLKDTEGRVWKLSDLRNKVVLVNFWASWCDSCKEENPSIQRLVNAGKGNDKLVILSVLFKDDPAKAMGYMKASGFSYPVLIDDKNISSRYGLTGVPETFIIDKKGTIRQKIVGPITWDTPEVRTALAGLIDEKS